MGIFASLRHAQYLTLNDIEQYVQTYNENDVTYT